MKAIGIGAFEAKTRLSELLERVRHGQCFLITKRGRPVAELRPPSTPSSRPRYGSDKGRIVIREDFDDPIPGFEDYTG